LVREQHSEYKLLRDTIDRYYQNFDFDLLERAYDYACAAHSGQFREKGEPYIMHPLHVSVILAELELDITSIIAGLLHDVVEDSERTLEDLAELFGEDVALIVDGVTKLDAIPYRTKEEQQSENIRKMIVAMSKDLRVILVKLADRLHNMRTMGVMSNEHKRLKSNETLEIYAPIANRLGIFKIQSELEDLCFQYLEPQAFAELSSELAASQMRHEILISEVSHQLEKKFAESNIKVHIEHRMKNIYSIFKKMRGQGKQLEEIYDIYAIRVIVNYLAECYHVLGIVHEEYYPMPGRFKDYIAMPKHNEYQSLHTTVIGESGTHFEVQIRTWEMHRVAEFGIAAHWRYKGGYTSGNAGQWAARQRQGAGYIPPKESPHETRQGSAELAPGRQGAAKVASGKQGSAEPAPGRQGSTELAPHKEAGINLYGDDQKLSWLKRLIEWQNDLDDTDGFVDDLKIDLFTDTVFVFSPKTDVYDLPNGSTPIDFAYRVHSAIGNRMNGARVNGRIVPISYRLQNGDMVEIMTSVNEHGPSRDWLDIAKSGQAKNKIKQWFKRENREENIVRGKELIEKEIKRQGFLPSQLLKPEWIELLLRRYSFKTLDDAYSAVGYDGISSTKLVQRLVTEFQANNKQDGLVLELVQKKGQEPQKPEKKSKKAPEGGILVRGVGNCLVRLSHCCNPVPGDPIVGFITRSRGVSVHRDDCANVFITDGDEKNRLVDVSWFEQITETYQAALLIVATNRPVLLNDITSSIGEQKIPIMTINAKVTRDNFAKIDLTLEINGKAQLDTIIKKLSLINSVVRVSRSLH